MSGPSERSDSSSTLPRAELNPLQNPLLAENMGRWAEVYFTSPPEKREEAVLDLLRELEAQGPGHAPAPSLEAKTIRATQIFERAEALRHESEPPAHQAIAACSRCGQSNPPTHQFCGMCGAALSSAAAEESRTDSPYMQHMGEMENVAHPAVPEPSHQSVAEPYAEEFRLPDDEVHSDPYDLSLLQGLRSREIRDYEYEEPPSPPYRYYVGAVLAILLVLLGYMAYRSGQVAQSSHQTSTPPPSAAENTSATPASGPPTNAPETPNRTKPLAPPLNSAPNTGAEAARQQAPQPRANQVAPSQNPAVAANAPATPAGAVEPPLTMTSGADDLAMAQRYLNGGTGQARDSAEAAKWLWKAMGKHNGPATLILADLYLKGDGVSKNCDQARVLLDSAARRGMEGAGQRLRNLRAFGCQ